MFRDPWGWSWEIRYPDSTRGSLHRCLGTLLLSRGLHGLLVYGTVSTRIQHLYKMKVLLKSQEIKFLYACEIDEAWNFVQTSLVFAL